jgi:GT2 family glycosyltransferase
MQREGWSPVGERTHILVLNHNGLRWLRDCLPSVVRAAAAVPGGCRVSVVDNASTDDSISYLTAKWPTVGVIREPNQGLASFNAVLARLTERVVVLLNNDVRLDEQAIAPLVTEVVRREDALFAAPQCWTADGKTFEGMRTRVRTRFGLVQGMSRVPGHEHVVDVADLTAAAGPVLAVHRERFLSTGGYDPVYFPGRIEDLDLGFRGWMAGLRGYYVPSSRAWHVGFGTFGPAFGTSGCDRLALRNSCVFAWKNLAGRRLANHLAWLPLRIARAIVLGQFGAVRAIAEAAGMLRDVMAARRRLGVGRGNWNDRQEAFFQRFAW